MSDIIWKILGYGFVFYIFGMIAFSICFPIYVCIKICIVTIYDKLSKNEKNTCTPENIGDISDFMFEWILIFAYVILPILWKIYEFYGKEIALLILSIFGFVVLICDFARIHDKKSNEPQKLYLHESNPASNIKTGSVTISNRNSEELNHLINNPVSEKPSTQSLPPAPRPTSPQIVFQDRQIRQELSQRRYKVTPTAAQTQRELDQWKAKWKDHEGIGREYERYVGYLCESKGLKVKFNGAVKGFRDDGRDLIVIKGDTRYVVQCKYWGKGKEIHSNHINQIFGTTAWLSRQYPQYKHVPVFVTNKTIEPDARNCATALDITIFENVAMKERPVIKCNLNSHGERIYHLPFDSSYDYVEIGGKKGSFYAWTVVEAEEKGFRRAFFRPQI